MGMFDYICCEYPLPGNPPAWATEFQTKDFACKMDRYKITADGRLICDDGSDISAITATICFYDSNIVATGLGVYTSNGEDAESIEYSVVFVAGKLVSLREVSHTKELAAKARRHSYAITKEERDQIDVRRAESLLGRTMCVWWGGDSDGYAVKVVYENAEKWVVENEKGNVEIIRRSDRDSTFFDSYEDGQRDKNERAAKWEAERLEYEKEINEVRV